MRVKEAKHQRFALLDVLHHPSSTGKVLSRLYHHLCVHSSTGLKQPIQFQDKHLTAPTHRTHYIRVLPPRLCQCDTLCAILGSLHSGDDSAGEDL